MNCLLNVHIHHGYVCAQFCLCFTPDEMRCSSIMSSRATMQLCSSCKLSTRPLAAVVLGHKMDCASSWEANVLTESSSSCPWLLVLSCATTCLLGTANTNGDSTGWHKTRQALLPGSEGAWNWNCLQLLLCCCRMQAAATTHQGKLKRCQAKRESL